MLLKKRAAASSKLQLVLSFMEARLSRQWRHIMMIDRVLTPSREWLQILEILRLCGARCSIQRLIRVNAEHSDHRILPLQQEAGHAVSQYSGSG